MATLGYCVREPTPPGDGPPLVLLHGFTQTRASFEELASRWASRRLVLVDLPGHGASAAVAVDLGQAADLVAEVLHELGESPADVLGYSLGGRLALHLALLHPGEVRALVAVSASPGLADPAARSARRRRDEALAERLEADGDVAAFVRRWLAAPMFATLPPERAGIEARLANTPGGLASSLRRCGLGAQAPLWDRLCTLERPALFVAGATDPRYVALAHSMATAAPAGVFSVVPGAGHAVVAEQPALFARVVGSWLKGLDALAA